MKCLKNKSNYLSFITLLVISISLSSCSDDSEQQIRNNVTHNASTSSKNLAPKVIQSSDKKNYIGMSKPLDEASWTEQGKFKKQFSEDCINREMQNTDKVINKQELKKNCDCIANHMANNLTDDEADEYFKDDNHTRSLQIRFDAAAYSCLSPSS